MNPLLNDLYDYPFTRLKSLLAGVVANAELDPIALSVGEPQHQVPVFVCDALVEGLDRLNAYPSTQGDIALRQAIANWLDRRYQLGGAINPETMVLPVLGTREALFAVAQAVVDATIPCPLVMLPSPFYQIYEGAAIMAGAKPFYMPCTEENHFLPDLDLIDDAEWQRCQLFYLCNPSNPTGKQLDDVFYQRLLELADRFDFVVVSDECYSEIYPDESRPCVGLLEVCAKLKRDDFSRCLVFNSLSKRSNLAGLRSGFVAGDAKLLKSFLLYRTYHGSAMSFHHQQASIAAWRDESHVIENRALYRQKFESVLPILRQQFDVALPEGGFCLWLNVPGDDEQFAKGLYQEKNVIVLPGSYLAREVDGVNAGKNYVRIALVYDEARCIEAARRIVDYLQI